MTNTIINSLIQLLEDPDDEVYFNVKNKFLEYGPPIIAKLEKLWEENPESLIQTRVEEIICLIQFNYHYHLLQKWLASSKKDLIEFWIILTRHQFPNFDERPYFKQLSILENEAKHSIRCIEEDFEKIAAFNHFLFQKIGFKGNTKNYHSPKNSCINYVMDNKKGNPLSLSVIYLYLSNRIGLPICGVNMPRHFIVGFENEGMGDPIKFYINPFSKGTILNRHDLTFFLQKENINEETKYFSPCGNAEIAKRMLNNLLYSYTYQDNKEKSVELIKFLELFKHV